MENLLITGGCGFIGSNFINYIFKQNKFRIINIDNLYYCANENNVNENVRNNDNYIFIKGNICSQDLVNHILNFYNIDYVIHFAAQSHVQNSFDDSLNLVLNKFLYPHIRKMHLNHKLVHLENNHL